jgi:hypothetical protein
MKGCQAVGDAILAQRPDESSYSLRITAMDDEICSPDDRRADGVIIHRICYIIE